jgi:hypothetical protein
MTQVVNHQVDLPEATTSRRRLIASLLAGGAVAATAPFLAGNASAADDSGPSTTAPPHRDSADNPTLNAALDRESRMAATYELAVRSAKDDDKAALLLVHDHHVAYAQALKGYLGTNASSASTQPLANPSGSVAAMARQLAALEEETVAIHTSYLESLRGINAASLVESIITVEARHVAALNIIAGTSPIAVA